jgi:WD40 repeat protein/serine/threonine protein kinase
MGSESSDDLVLLNQLADEFIARCRRGERPALEEYTQRHPELADQIRELFPTIAQMAQADLTQIVSQAAPAGQLPPQEQLGDFRIVREIGRGGMGVVYEAEQASLGRHVALKVLPRQLLVDPRAKLRFVREARAAARLHHTNIVPVFGVGAQNGLPYYAMQLIPGIGLDVAIAELARPNAATDRTPARPEVVALARLLLTGSERAAENVGRTSADATPSDRPAGPSGTANTSARLPSQGKASSGVGRRTFWGSVARVGYQVAGALAYAHRQGIVHRDIKPSNLLLDQAGTVWITDFGLAKSADQQHLTQTGDIVGTLRYLPPEAFEGKSDARGDVYSLGLTLYELAALRPAFAESDRNRLIKQVTTEEPEPLGRVRQGIPRDLETIIHRAMERDPARRYQKAEDLADDLRRFLDDQPVKARRTSALERLGRWARRNRGAATALGVIALLLIGVAIASSLAALRFERLAGEREVARTEAVSAAAKAVAEKERADSAAAKAVAEKERADREADAAWANQYIAHMNRVDSDWEHGTINRILDTLELYRNPPPERKDLRGWEWHYQDRLCHQELRTLRGHTNAVYSVIFSPDGRRLASCGLDFTMSTGPDFTIKWWDAASGQEIRTLRGHTGIVKSVAVSPDGTHLASGSDDQTVRLWDVASGQEIRTLRGHTGGVHSVAFSPDGTRVASGSFDRTVKLWDAATGREIRTLKGHAAPVNSVAFGPDGTRLASGSDDLTVWVWDVANGRELLTLRGHTQSVGSVAFGPDGTRVASGSFDQTVKLWDAVSGQELRTLKGHSLGRCSVAFSPDGTRLASGSFDQTVKLWDAVSGQELRTLKGHTDLVYSVAFSPDGLCLASAGSDRTVKLWGAASDRGIRTLKGHRLLVSSVAFSPDGTQVVSGALDQTVKLWDAASSREIRTLKGHRGMVHSVAFSPDGTQVASGSFDETVKLWDAASGREIRTLKGHRGMVYSVAFSPDGTRVASGADDGTVKLWDAASGRELRTLRGHTGLVHSVAFSPDGSRLASGSADWTVKLWDAGSGREIRILSHTGLVCSVAFSPDGTRVASGGNDQTVKLWDAASGRELRTLKGHRGMVNSVAFSPDGTRLASCGEDQTVRVWDAASGQELCTLKGHTNFVQSVAFSADGTRLASGSRDETVKLWDGRPVTPAVQAEVEAVALLDGLFSRPLSRTDVCAALNKQGLLSEAVRQQALELAGRFPEETDPRKYLEAAWPVVRHPHANVFTCELAVAQMKAACRLAPGVTSFRRALGVAQYRLGRFHHEECANARASLLKDDQNHPTTLAFLAMSQFQEGQKERARDTLARLRELDSTPPWSTDAEAASFLREAATLIEDKPTKPRP